jgi:hypothetical protein
LLILLPSFLVHSGSPTTTVYIFIIPMACPSHPSWYDYGNKVFKECKLWSFYY